MDDRLERFLAAYELSRRARRIIRQNRHLARRHYRARELRIAEKTRSRLASSYEGSTLIVVLNSQGCFHEGRKVRRRGVPLLGGDADSVKRTSRP
jgi:hypothetical protein